MALPTTNLTLHLDASDLGTLWKTFVSGGPNTGVPSDGDSIQAWEDAQGASLLGKQNASNGYPTVKITTPLMANQCLDFSGTSQNLQWSNLTGTGQALSTIIANNAFTVFIAAYPEAGGSFENYLGSAMIGDSGGYWGIYQGNDSGTYKASVYNYDGTGDWVSIAAPLNESHVIMARHDGGNLYLSVDDGSESSVASGNTSSLTGTVLLGSSGWSFFDGRIGEIAVYNAALSGTDFDDAMAYFVGKWLTPPAAGGARAFATLVM